MASTEAAERPRTSDLLFDLAAAHPGPRISLGEIVHAFGERGFGVLILLLALPNALPGPAMPGVSAIFAIPLAVLAAQLAGGRAEPRLPQWLLRRSVSLAGFRRVARYAVPTMRRVEAWLRPRPGLPSRRWLGLALLVLTLAFAMPIPFANVPPAAVLTLIALGLIEKDGLAVRVGLALGVFACLWVGTLTVGGYRLVATMLGQ
jgi:hypothetical protein